MKKKILMLCMGCFFVSLTAKAQWVVSDPGNLAQGIINAAKNIGVSYLRAKKRNDLDRVMALYGSPNERYW